MQFTIEVWRQANRSTPGRFVTYQLQDIGVDASFLEMLDILNEQLIADNESPIAFDHDCREGICGTCGCVVNGHPHGHQSGTTLCQLHMRSFSDGQRILIEPWRAKPFPVLKDLIVDRSALDQIIQVGGFVSVNTGSAKDANNIPISKRAADEAMDAAQCIGCGACVASCPNASAMLFTSAKINHLAALPQGQPERTERTQKMVIAMEGAGFGACTNHGECEATCPKEIRMSGIARLNREVIRAWLLT